MASGARYTKSRRFQIGGSAEPAVSLKWGWYLRSSRWQQKKVRRLKLAKMAGCGLRATARARRISSTLFLLRKTAPRLLLNKMAPAGPFLYLSNRIVFLLFFGTRLFLLEMGMR